GAQPGSFRPMRARSAGLPRGARAPQPPSRLQPLRGGGGVLSSVWSFGLSALLLSIGLLGGCDSEARSPGVDPPNDRLAVPHGMLLDPRISDAGSTSCTDASECAADQSCVAGGCRTPARWMFVVNANSDLTYNSGTIIGFDLDAFFTAFRNTDELGGQGAKLSEARPCRRAELQPNLIECEERYFAAADATIHIGHFASNPDGWNCEVLEISPAAAPGMERVQTRRRHCAEGEGMILTPINGDPSINYAYIR